MSQTAILGNPTEHFRYDRCSALYQIRGEVVKYPSSDAILRSAKHAEPVVMQKERTASAMLGCDRRGPTDLATEAMFLELRRSHLRRVAALIDEALEISDEVDEAHIGALLSHALAIAETRLEQCPN